MRGCRKSRLRIDCVASLLAATLGVFSIPAVLAGSEDGRELGPAITRGIDYLEPAVSSQPYGLVFVDFLRRRFRLKAFTAAPHRYDALMASRPDLVLGKGEDAPSVPEMRLFRRLIHPDSQLVENDLQLLKGRMDRATVRALYCDQSPLSPDFAGDLGDMVKRGGFESTHAGISLLWMRDLGCPWPVSDRQVAAWADAWQKLIEDEPAHETAYEAAGLLAYLGYRDRIPSGYSGRVAAAANPDGGWSRDTHESASHWHSTILALWFLLEEQAERTFDTFARRAKSASRDAGYQDSRPVPEIARVLEGPVDCAIEREAEKVTESTTAIPGGIVLAVGDQQALAEQYSTPRFVNYYPIYPRPAEAKGNGAEFTLRGMKTERWRPEVSPVSKPLGIYEVSVFPCSRELSPERMAAANRLVTETKDAARERGWFDFDRAVADGFYPMAGISDHYVNDEYAADGRILDPARPEFLMYGDIGGRKTLTGVMFIMPGLDLRGPQVGGPLTIWHYHVMPPACYENGIGVGLPDTRGECARGVRSSRSPEMLHVWFIERDHGPFASDMSPPGAAEPSEHHH